MSNDFEKDLRSALLNSDKKLHLEMLNQKEIGLNDELKLKLQFYSILLRGHLNWEIKSQYLELVTQFIEKKMKIFEFIQALRERYQSVQKIKNLLQSNRILLSPNKNSLEFEKLISRIEDYCEGYSGDPEPLLDKYEIGEIEFTNFMEKIYFQLKELIQE
jgi:hypothetical protein